MAVDSHEATKLRAHEFMLLAHGQILEMLLGVVLGQVSVESSDSIKADLKRNAGKYLRDYVGGPQDVAALQDVAEVIQSAIDHVLSGAERVEQTVRRQRGQSPGR